jgi:hypothetical protein
VLIVAIMISNKTIKVTGIVAVLLTLVVIISMIIVAVAGGSSSPASQSPAVSVTYAVNAWNAQVTGPNANGDLDLDVVLQSQDVNPASTTLVSVAATSATYTATVQWPDGHYVVLVDTPASGLGYEVTSSGLATSPPDNGFGVNATLNSQGYMAVN